MPTPSVDKPQVSRLLIWFARLLLRLGRWQLVRGSIPPKAVIVGAPHTSYWDGVIALTAAYALGLRFRWLGKQQLFEGPLAPLMRATGGIPIDRSRSKNVVDQVAEQFAAHDRFYVIITPEGTRGPVPYWKSGFYQIAKKAGVPIVLAFIDYRKKEIGIGISIDPDDRQKDLQTMREFYRNVTPRHPANQGPVAFPPD